MLTFIGAAYLTRTSEHLGFDAVVRILPPGVKRAVMAGNLILMAFFGAFSPGMAASPRKLRRPHADLRRPADGAVSATPCPSAAR
jgi:hypothetical protein